MLAHRDEPYARADTPATRAGRSRGGRACAAVRAHVRARCVRRTAARAPRGRAQQVTDVRDGVTDSASTILGPHPVDDVRRRSAARRDAIAAALVPRPVHLVSTATRGAVPRSSPGRSTGRRPPALTWVPSARLGSSTDGAPGRTGRCPQGEGGQRLRDPGALVVPHPRRRPARRAPRRDPVSAAAQQPGLSASTASATPTGSTSWCRWCPGSAAVGQPSRSRLVELLVVGLAQPQVRRRHRPPRVRHRAAAARSSRSGSRGCSSCDGRALLGVVQQRGDVLRIPPVGPAGQQPAARRPSPAACSSSAGGCGGARTGPGGQRRRRRTPPPAPAGATPRRSPAAAAPRCCAPRARPSRPAPKAPIASAHGRRPRRASTAGRPSATWRRSGTTTPIAWAPQHRARRAPRCPGRRPAAHDAARHERGPAPDRSRHARGRRRPCDHGRVIRRPARRAPPGRRSGSAAGEPRRALLPRRRQALEQVVARERHRLRERLPLQRVLVGRVPTAGERRPSSAASATGAPEATWCAACSTPATNSSSPDTDDTSAEPQHLLGVAHPTGEQQVARRGDADHLGQQPRGRHARDAGPARRTAPRSAPRPPRSAGRRPARALRRRPRRRR